MLKRVRMWVSSAAAAALHQTEQPGEVLVVARAWSSRTYLAIIKGLKGVGSLSGATDGQLRKLLLASKALQEQLHNQETRSNAIAAETVFR